MTVDLTEQDIKFLLSVLANTPISGKRNEVAQLINTMDAIAAKLAAALKTTEKDGADAPNG